MAVAWPELGQRFTATTIHHPFPRVHPLPLIFDLKEDGILQKKTKISVQPVNCMGKRQMK
jgi:hypothetical protein